MFGRHKHGPYGPRGGLPFAMMALASGRDPWGPGSDWYAEHGSRDPESAFGGRRGGGRRRMFGSGELRLVLLKLIADEPRHGYDLIRAIEDLTHGSYAPSPGVVYPTLTLLEDMGQVEVQQADGTRKKFAVTDAGRTELQEKADEVAELFERLEATGHHRRRSSRPEIGRAMRNLMTALGNRAGKDGWSEDVLNEVVDIIDEAAKRIERTK